MASIRLRREELERYDPPKVCMKCGAPSCVVVRKRFSWNPTSLGGFYWFGLIGLLIGGLLALLQTKSVTVDVPLCHQHKGHWSTRLVINLLLFFVVLLSVGLVVVLAAFVPDFELGPVSVFVPIGVFVVWLIVAAVLRSTAIRPTEINEYQITLTGVSHGYVEALREEWGYDDDYDRPRRGRRRYEDEDDEDRPRRKRRRYEDGDEEDDRSRRRRRRYEAEEDETPRPNARDRSEGIFDPRNPKRQQGNSDAIQSDED